MNMPVTNLRSITSGERGGSEKKNKKQNKQDTTPRQKIREKNKPDRKNLKSMKP
jgi:hypothetical protein